VPNLEIFDAGLHVWQNAQQPMADELRWKNNFPQLGQTLVMHTSSVPLVPMELFEFFRRFKPAIDELLILQAFILHDHGEPLSGGDEDAYSKTVDKDKKEWEAFKAMLDQSPECVRAPWLRAFTLPYAIKEDAYDLPPYAWHLVNEHRGHNMNSALFFDFCERIDYLRSARVGYLKRIRNPHEGIMEHTFGNQAPKLDALCKRLPVLRHYWTDELRASLAELAEFDAEGLYTPGKQPTL